MHNTFAIDIIPPRDALRVEAMRRYRLLDSPSETVFDNMTTLAARLFGTPVTLISLVDAELVFFKSSTGAGGIKCADRGESLCALAILSPEVMVFEDARLEPIVAESAPVKQGVCFYAGAPLRTKDGYLIGTLCAADFKPRKFGARERALLEDMARIVMEQMELRLAALTEIEQQQQLAGQKDEFISVASHELRTPLTSLTASLQLMDRIKNGAPAELKTLIAHANRSLKKLNRLVADLLNLQRIGSGALPLNKTTFLLSRMFGTIKEEMADRRIVFTAGTGVEVFADEQKVEQVLLNLLGNALKYAPAGQISVSVATAGGFARIAVRDEGPGISEPDRARIFERYYRTARHNVSGLGLGLYISSEIIRQHGGEIGVESEPGKGSTFWFTLGLAADAGSPSFSGSSCNTKEQDDDRNDQK